MIMLAEFYQKTYRTSLLSYQAKLKHYSTVQERNESHLKGEKILQKNTGLKKTMVVDNIPLYTI